MRTGVHAHGTQLSSVAERQNPFDAAGYPTPSMETRLPAASRTASHGFRVTGRRTYRILIARVYYYGIPIVPDQLAKIEVNGPNADPIYKFLKSMRAKDDAPDAEIATLLN